VSSFRPLPTSRIPSYRRAIKRAIAAGAFGGMAVRVDFNDGSHAIRNAGESRCVIVWAAGIDPEVFTWG